MSSQNSDKKQKLKISRRALLILGAQIAGIGALGARAKYLQIDQNDHYLLLAEDNRIDTVLKPASRGYIYDVNGLLLAENIHDLRVDIDTSLIDDPTKTLEKLSQIIDLSDSRKAELIRIVTDAKDRSINARINVADQLTWEQFSVVNENLPVLSGVEPQIAQSRFYPYRDLFAHQIGYVGRVSQRDIDNMASVPPVYHTPNMAIGKTGIEANLEEELRGIEAQRVLEKNAHRRVVRQIKNIPSAPGKKIQLTLDANLNHYAIERLKNESASAVIVDITNGDIKLLASNPSFDANKFVRGISHDDYNALLEDNHFPLNHKAVHGVYPPGSTFKMVVALAALETGAVDRGTSFHCSGKINRGRDFHCWKSSGHGTVNLKNSLKYSCDVYYYNASERASIDNISKMARKLGLEERYDIPQSAVAKGLVPDREWKKKNKDEDWVIGDTLNTSIGQGFVLASPLQLAIMTARIASGKVVKPNMVANINGVPTEREPFDDLDINPDHLNWVRQGMYAVSNEQRGTAYSSRINADGQKWAGKTGTVQVVAISKAERESGVLRNEQRKWAHRDHALYVAFAPYDNPKYAISVVVEHCGGGSTTAAPIARDLMLYALYGAVPPLNAYPTNRGNAANFWRNAPSLETKRDYPETELDEDDTSSESA